MCETGIPTDWDCARFVARFGSVYEHSDWIMEQIWREGLDADCGTVSGLLARAMDVVERAGYDCGLRLLRAHPDLAGRLGRDDRLTSFSADEQRGAGLDRCTAAEYEEFLRLNERYRDRFGFPFIIAVRGLDRGRILQEFRRRVAHDEQSEYREAIAQVHRIARLRLEALVEE